MLVSTMSGITYIEDLMKISIIAGSHRKNSESQRVAEYVEKNLNKIGISSTNLISLAGNPLPFWDEEVWSKAPKWDAVWGPIAKQLQESSALVVVTPEWAGMVPAGLKNLFLLCGATDVAHKPALIVSVSSGVGGSYPVNELRISSYKNSRICYIPDHVIIRQVGEMLKGDVAASSHDDQIRKRLDYSLRVLVEYGKALTLVRESGVLDYKAFPFGL